MNVKLREVMVLVGAMAGAFILGKKFGRSECMCEMLQEKLMDAKEG